MRDSMFGAVRMPRSLLFKRRTRRIAAVLLAGLIAWPSLAVAQTPGDDAPGDDAGGNGAPGEGAGDDGAAGGGTADPERVSCDDAAEAFRLLCVSYDLIDEHYIDPFDVEDLASAAAKGVREAGLSPRASDPPPPCALPAPEFELVCAEIDAAADTAAAATAAATAMVASLGDSNSYLLTPQQQEEHEAQSGVVTRFSGIGVRLGLLDGVAPCKALSETCRVTVSEVMRGSPAERAGLLPYDVLLDIDGLVPSGEGCGLADLTRPEPGAPVRVTMERDGVVLRFVIEAALVDVPIAAGQIVGDNIGYVSLQSFRQSADGALAEVLKDLIDKGAESLVIDLRGNLGGILFTTVNVGGFFLDAGDVIAREVSRKETRLHRAARQPGDPDASGLPLVVLVNDSSASASEMLSLALRDHGRATLVGEATFGKTTGHVTWTVESDDGRVLGFVRLGTLRWFSPEGATAAGGIQPDIAADFPNCGHPVGVARQAAAAAGLSGAELADIGRSGERFEAVRALDEDGVLAGTGCAPGLFCPRAALPRWMMAVWLSRVLDGSDPDPVDSSRFEDVDPSQWWAPHVERLAGMGISVECEQWSNRFCPDEPLTRGEAARIIQQAFNVPAAVSAGFTDISDRPTAAAASALFRAGITRGCSNNAESFCPDDLAKRAQMAVFLHRAKMLP